MNLKIKKIIFAFVFLYAVALPAAVFALETTYPTVFGLSLGDDPTLPEYARYFFNIGIISAGILAVIVVAMGGIFYLLAFAKGQFTDNGKDWIKAGILGLLLIMSAYLIAYTINPYLVIFDLKGLAPLTFLANILNPPSSPSLPIEMYNEIPIGTLTENLLSRQMDCYDFDGNGNPILSTQITIDGGATVYGPTYLEHDRADCFLKISEAIEKKSKIAENLSQKIADLMLMCSCAQPNSTCGTAPSIGASNDQCKPSLTDDDCKIGASSQYYCEQVIQKACAPESPDCERCPIEVKSQIEQGPIYINDIGGYCDGFYYQGLNEFRTQFNNDYSIIEEAVEIRPTPELNGKKLTIIDTAAEECGSCNYNCPVCLGDDEECQKERASCKSDEAQCKKNQVECLKANSPWHNLRLIDQITYLKGKAEEMKESIQKDLSNLEKGEAELQKCYLADSYVDFLKTYEKTDKTQKTIVVTTNYKDTGAGDGTTVINPTKYCAGYQYANSDCYSQCQKQCPGTSEEDVACYRKISDCSNAADLAQKKKCLDDQAEKMKECYDKRTCLPDLSPFVNFQQCMDTCKSRCVDFCDQQACSEQDKQECKNACENDSKCLQENEGVCLVDFNQLKDCTDPETCKANCQDDEDCKTLCAIQRDDPDFIKNCMENSAALCTYCSDQNAGYPDCVKYDYYTKGNYSSSYIYDHKESQICANPDALVAGGVTCQSNNLQTAKCPSASSCPDCPCGTTEDEKRVCSGTCDSYSFNDDPLTFYCNEKWWEKDDTKKQEPLGENMTCPKEKEIPVGNTVDDSEKWANDFLNAIDGMVQKTDSFIKYLDGIGKEINYCKCSSSCQPGEQLCLSKCVYSGSSGSGGGSSSGGGGTACPAGQCKGLNGVCAANYCSCPAGTCMGSAGVCRRSYCPSPECGGVECMNENGDCDIDYCGCQEGECLGPDGCWTGYCTNSTGAFLYPSAKVYADITSGSEETSAPSCTAAKQCSGNPCQKMINLLIGKLAGNSSTGNADGACPKGIDEGFEGVSWHSQQISAEAGKVKTFIESGNRSDIVKELEYSRNGVSSCSQNYSKQATILSCTRVEDEIMPPIIGSTNSGKAIINNQPAVSSYCYGQALGEVKGADPKADNWFCCQSK